MQRQELIKIYKDTQRLAAQTSTSYKQSEMWDFREDLPPDDALFQEAERYDQSAVINVVDGDTLTIARSLPYDVEDVPLILNMASDFCPGGGVKKGCRAQEEKLFQRTNYCNCTNGKFYPLGESQFVITEGVLVMKDEDYNVLRDYKSFDFIAMPGVRKPHINADGEYEDEDEEQLMKDKIDAIFRYAVYQEKSTLVLGALGCGAFGNPPERVREMFQECIDKYRYYLKNITFAVLSGDKNPNYSVFKSLK